MKACVHWGKAAKNHPRVSCGPPATLGCSEGRGCPTDSSKPDCLKQVRGIRFQKSATTRELSQWELNFEHRKFCKTLSKPSSFRIPFAYQKPADTFRLIFLCFSRSKPSRSTRLCWKNQPPGAAREAQMEPSNCAFRGGLKGTQPHTEQPAENKARAPCLRRERCPSCCRSAEEAPWKKNRACEPLITLQQCLYVRELARVTKQSQW